jgi:predicted nucleic acid-binding protein
MFLLDTNVVSEKRKPKPHGAVVGWLSSVVDEDIFVSAMTVAEIQAGIELTRVRDPAKAAEIEHWLEWMIESTQILSMDAEIGRVWARMMRGRPRSLADDAWIAATAKCRGLTIATRNAKDFEGFGVDVFNPFEDVRPRTET